MEWNVIGSRKRSAVDSQGKAIGFVIRRLRCKSCRHIHHELPDLLVPYKRHLSKTFEAVIDGNFGDVPCEDSTIQRIHQWFGKVGLHIAGCLKSMLDIDMTVNSIGFSLLQRIKQMVGTEAGWLSRAVRIVTNSNNWIHTRSAFMSG